MKYNIDMPQDKSAKTTRRVCFVIPTYNEAQNIAPLLRRLCALYAADARQFRYSFLIVDDDSPDGTAGYVREFARRDKRVHLLQGRRRGLGNAYLRGIGHALNALRADVVVQMDADFSHNPKDARRLLARIDDADVVIGSRYVEGGAVDRQWSVARRMLSRWGNRLARWVAGLSAVRDCTAGFKAIRSRALRAANIERIGVQGYAFQVVLLHRLMQSGARVVEMPVYFRDRERGQTKLGLRDLIEFFHHIWWIRLIRHRIFAKFAVTGVIGLLVNLGSFQLLLNFGVHKLLASPLAIQLSVVSNFLINHDWTFAERVLAGRKSIRGMKFGLVSLFTLAVSYGAFIALSHAMPQVHPLWLQACAVVPAALLNYFLNTRWTFRES